jgi:hypothetical protein
MSILERKIYKINPGYLLEYEDLIKNHAQFGGGSSDNKFSQGRSFSNVYEFYIYAFFIGLYKGVSLEILDSDKKNKFWEIENWKPKELVDYLLICTMAETDFDMVGIENMNEADVYKQIALLKNGIEGYANGGLKLIQEMFENTPDLIDDDTLFIRLLAENS